jgi:hypothetical protein
VTPPHIIITKRFPHLFDHTQELISQLVRILDPDRAIVVADEPVGGAFPEVIFHQKKVNGELHHVRLVWPPASRHPPGFQFNRDDPAAAVVEKIVGLAAQAVVTGNEYPGILAARIFVNDLSAGKAAPPAKVPRNEQAEGGQQEK